MKIRCFALPLLLLCLQLGPSRLTSMCGLLHAQETTSVYQASWALDLSLGAVSVTTFALPFLLTPALAEPTPLERIPALDLLAVRPFDQSQDKVSTLLAYGLLLAPAGILAVVPPSWESAATYALMYGEAFMLAYGIKDTIKSFVSRHRPYTYHQPPVAGDEDDYYNSMPSGHTTLAFLGASFLATTLFQEDVDPVLRWTLSLAGFAGATAVGVLRISSGNHFITDVLAGAAIGTACGFVVPTIHRQRQ